MAVHYTVSLSNGKEVDNTYESRSGSRERAQRVVRSAAPALVEEGKTHDA